MAEAEEEATPTGRKVAAAIGIALLLIIVVSVASFYQLVLLPTQTQTQPQSPPMPPAEQPTTPEAPEAATPEAVPTPEPTPAPEEVQEGAAGAVSLVLRVTDSDVPWGFVADGEVNPTLRFKAGQEVRIKFVNDGVTIHDLTIEAFGVTPDLTTLAPGEEVEVVFTADEPGEYTYFCAQPGHKDLGMAGTIVVEE